MTERTGRPWLNYLLGLLCVGAIVVAVLLVGPASGSTNAVTRTAKVAEGVVQSTVSGSGNLQPASQLNLGFKTSGTVTKIFVTQGEHVTEGKLVAELNPQSAEVTLEQAKAALLSAEANLAKEQETGGEGAAGSGNSGSGGDATAAAASVGHAGDAMTVVSAGVPAGSSPTVASADASPTGASADTSPSDARTPTSTTPSDEQPHAGTPDANGAPTTTTPRTTSTEPTRTTPAKSVPEGERRGSRSEGSSSNTRESSSTEGRESSGASSSKTISAATREANLASARAAVRSAQLTVQSDEEAVGDTKLYAPQDGTIVSLSGQVGEVVSGSGTTKDSSSSSSTGSGSSATGASATTGRAGAGASSSSSSADSGSTGSSSSAFAVLSDLSSMQLVVALSESEIGNVKVGQIATVTVEALEGRKLAARVSEIATLSTSSSGVVSYDVTFQLDQMEAGLKPGMSATAEVVVKQDEGLNVPTAAISAGSVTVVRGGKDVRQRVVAGLAGDTSTIVLSGLKAGETVLLPAATSTSSSTSLTSRLSRLAGGGGLGGGGGGGGFAGGGAAFFRGGG
ncbi:MAG TPA: efflux RND transporter periplasmic adaptor subunit [Solirubrobacteraceae bacterium]|jgi:multidrug efflux pump subunit AcrA (membrane-fusion protein)|nr:efflux RND transporter periplasmic adaptor subunit [Solirubrobacteraceae bacterium]